MKEFRFKDSTIVECDGYYECVNKLLLKELFTGEKRWMVSSDLILITEFGVAVFKLNFYNTKKCEITYYTPSNKEYNEDIQNICEWLNIRGWDIPYINDDLAKIEESTWKKYWLTGIVVSERLHKRYKHLLE